MGIGESLAETGAVAIVKLPGDWLELKRQLLELLEQSEAERAASLSHLQRADPQRAADLQRLILAAQSEYLERPAWARIAVPEAEPAAPLERIGPWRITSELGRGGMGTVYRAERDDGSFVQTVAIKLIRPELASTDLRRRFDSERQILASLEHPNVARLLDAGTTADGAPYLVLEHVAGEPIDRYCDAHSLSLDRRLLLFRRVCDAVLVAHQKLILHRDIKTANVLIDVHGVPKLLDFGIAKLLTPDAKSSDLTVIGFARPLTPEWSSPEQLRGEPLTTAADVYSLGVLLYLLLTGRRPHVNAGKSPDGFASAIEASRPAALRSAAREQPPPGVAIGRLRGDLDRLVQKALAPSPAERYPTVAAFDADIGRLMAGRPIEAHTRSVAYRFGKFLLRNRVASAAVILSVLGLLAATAFSLRQAAIAEQERERAEQRFNDVKRIANVVLFDLNDKLANIPGTLAVRQSLVEDALRYLDDLARQTGRDRDLLTELASAYERVAEVQGMPGWPGQGRSGDALASYQRALELHRRAHAAGASPMGEARVLSNMGSILAARGDSADARDRQLQAEAVLQAMPASTRSVDWVSLLAVIQVAAGDATWELGDIPGAAVLYQRALKVVRDGHEQFKESKSIERQIGVIEQRLGDAAAIRGDWQEARAHHGASLAADETLLLREPESLELQRDLGTDLSRVGAVAYKLGDHRGALAAHQRALELRKRLTLADPQDARGLDDTAESYLHYAQSLANLGRMPEAREAASRAVDGWRGLVERDPDNARMRVSLSNALAALARCESETGQRESALARVAEARRIRTDLAKAHPDFKLSDSSLVSLDALESAIRTGRTLPRTVAFVDPWEN